MAAKSTENTAAERQIVSEEETKIPHQVDKPKLEVVETSEFEEMSFVSKAKNVLRNKKFLAGVSSVVLIAAGVVAVRKRNENVSEDETTSD